MTLEFRLTLASTQGHLKPPLGTAVRESHSPHSLVLFQRPHNRAPSI